MMFMTLFSSLSLSLSLSLSISILFVQQSLPPYTPYGSQTKNCITVWAFLEAGKTTQEVQLQSFWNNTTTV